MTKEALKLALEALENSKPREAWFGSEPHEKAITAIKEALAQQSNEQEYQGSDAAKAAHMMDLYTALGVKFGEDPFAVIAKMRDAHLEREPVARVVEHGATVKLEWASADAAHNAKVGNLYTAPPQRTLVGLTDDEIINCGYAHFVSNQYPSLIFVVKQLEAKLKDKNNG